MTDVRPVCNRICETDHQYYCSTHRLSENRHCPNLDRVHSLGPEFRAECAPPVTTGDLSTAMIVAIGVLIVALIVTGIVLLF